MYKWTRLQFYKHYIISLKKVMISLGNYFIVITICKWFHLIPPCTVIMANFQCTRSMKLYLAITYKQDTLFPEKFYHTLEAMYILFIPKKKSTSFVTNFLTFILRHHGNWYERNSPILVNGMLCTYMLRVLNKSVSSTRFRIRIIVELTC